MYEIIIKRSKTVVVTAQEYQTLAASGNERDGGPVFGYVSIQKEKDIEVEVYRQKVETLDLKGVIARVNWPLHELVQEINRERRKA